MNSQHHYPTQPQGPHYQSPDGFPRSSKPAFDPTQPMGSDFQPRQDDLYDKQVSIDDFRPPRSSRGIVLTILVILVAIVSVIIGMRVMKSDDETTPTSSPTQTQPQYYDDPCANDDMCAVVENRHDQASGIMRVKKTSYDSASHTASLLVNITATEGTLPILFKAIDNQSTAQVYLPEAPSRSNDLRRSRIRQGETVEGWIHFRTQERQLTVTICDSTYLQVTALLVNF